MSFNKLLSSSFVYLLSYCCSWGASLSDSHESKAFFCSSIFWVQADQELCLLKYLSAVASESGPNLLLYSSTICT